MKTRRLLDAVDWGQFERAVFLSPHLDDAALSCAAAIAELQGRVSRLVVTVACGNPLPRGQRARQRKGFASPAERRKEDADAMTVLDADYLHLGFADCIYRRSPTTGDLIYKNSVGRFSSPSIEDGAYAEELFLVLRRLATGMGRVVIFSPMGIGRHVDHVLCAQVAMRLLSPRVTLLFYEDLPYVAESRRAGVDGPLAALERHGLAPVERLWVPVDVQAKVRACNCYTSQMPVLFPNADQLESALEHCTIEGEPAEVFWRARFDTGLDKGG